MSTRPAALAIVGSYPPPYGGVGIHVQRLCPLLERRGIDFVVYNATSDFGKAPRVIPVFGQRRTWILRYFFQARETAIYVMSGRLIAWVVTALMASLRGRRVLLRLRNAALPDWIRSSPWRRFWSGFALRRMTGVVCVSRLLLESARALGVAEDRLHWSPGFLPPAPADLDSSGLSSELREFLSAHAPLICANGKVDWYRGEDLYGLDQLVELAIHLRPAHAKLGIVVSFADFGPADQAYVDRLLNRAAEAGVRENLFFQLQPAPFVPVMAACDVFVRPTNTDGDAISVREALYLGLPTVASDAVVRPAGTRVHRTRDVGDLVEKVRDVLQSLPSRHERKPTLTREDEDRIERYLCLLEDVARGGEGRTRATAAARASAA